MKFAVVGAGAIGTFVGACLAAGGEDVALVARGAHLEAMRRRGVRVIFQTGEELTANIFATADPAEVGLVDVVFLALKAPSLRLMAPRLAPLLGAETPVVAGQNGIPWWYFEKCGGPLEGTHLDAVDPGGLISAAIPARRVIGCVIYCSIEIAEPGVVRQIEGNRFAIGELDGARSERCRRISQAFQKGGLKCAVRSRIRHDIWVKLIGSLAFNPISALARADMDEIVRDPRTRALARVVMEEGEAVARASGMELEITVDQRLEGAARVGAHKTSTLQDLEMGRPLELDAIVGAVVELAEKLGVAVPHTRTLYACAGLLEKRALQGASGSVK
jgi:2-dehydropantoate 2-reductase